MSRPFLSLLFQVVPDDMNSMSLDQGGLKLSLSTSVPLFSQQGLNKEEEEEKRRMLELSFQEENKARDQLNPRE